METNPIRFANQERRSRSLYRIAISAEGYHHTLTAAQGTEKHIYCVNVLEYDKLAIIHEKADCTGKSCFIHGEGNWRTWAKGAQANCIDINPVTLVSVPPFLAPDQEGKWPRTGGFPQTWLFPWAAITVFLTASTIPIMRGASR